MIGGRLIVVNHVATSSEVATPTITPGASAIRMHSASPAQSRAFDPPEDAIPVVAGCPTLLILSPPRATATTRKSPE